jgi:Flp pilus assembly protein TadD
MIHNNLGLLYVSMKKPEQAVDALETAVELFGDEVPHYVFNNLGLAYEAAGDLEDARDAFEQALAANPTYSRARVNLERVLTAIAAQPPAPEPEPAAGHAAVDPNDDDGAGALVSTRGCASTELK